MKYNPKKHHRRSIRLKGYDYSQSGAYFVTLCTQNRACLFGDIVGGEMRLNDTGKIVADSWRWLASQYDYVELDEWVVMPNHIHGIIIVHDCRGDSRITPTEKRKPIGRLIGAFKTVSTKHINIMRGTPGIPVWQRNYYEHIIRNDTSLNRIRAYIVNNPIQWELDMENSNIAGSIHEMIQTRR
ncbi:MAG TPA: transposase [Bacteroidales bacterium]|nr:transposase [Bacteroidales bacterium]